MYAQVIYCLDRVPNVAIRPKSKDVELIKTVLSTDRRRPNTGGTRAIVYSEL
jgi:hypothetical protein